MAAASMCSRARASGSPVPSRSARAAVGVELTRAGDGHLHEARRQGREEHRDRQQRAEEAARGRGGRRTSAENMAMLGGEGDGRGDGGGDRTDEDVAVPDVHELVGQHALAARRAAACEDALRAAHDGMRGVAAGGEGVRAGQGGRDGDDAASGSSARWARLAHDAVELGRLAARRRTAPAAALRASESLKKYEPPTITRAIRRPRAAPPRLAEQDPAHPDEEPTEGGEQHRGLEGVLDRLHPNLFQRPGRRLPSTRTGIATGCGRGASQAQMASRTSRTRRTTSLSVERRRASATPRAW